MTTETTTTTIPAGWKLVPRVPTERMISAGLSARITSVDPGSFARSAAFCQYQGMVEAAPSPAPAAPSAAQEDALPIGYIPIPQGLHQYTASMVCAFAAALAARLALSENKPRRGSYWQRTDWRDELVMQLQRHVTKGDPLDVAAYCAFAWHHQWSIAPDQPAQGGSVSEAAKRIAWAVHLRHGPALYDDANDLWSAMSSEKKAEWLVAARASAPAAPEVVEAAIASWRDMQSASTAKARVIARGRHMVAMNVLAGLPNETAVDGDMGQEPVMRQMTDDEVRAALRTAGEAANG